MSARMGRPPMFTPEERKVRRKQQKLAYDNKRRGGPPRVRLAKEQPSVKRRAFQEPASSRPSRAVAQSSDEFIAQGGKYEVLPTKTEPFTRYPRGMWRHGKGSDS